MATASVPKWYIPLVKKVFSKKREVGTTPKHDRLHNIAARQDYFSWSLYRLPRRITPLGAFIISG
ncbi:MAG: hypothetical protein AAF850_00835 [Pseudomonadota bacterium]